MSTAETARPAHAIAAILAQAALAPQAPALRSENGAARLSRQGLADLIATTGQGLARMQARPGDRILLPAVPGPMTPVALVALSAYLTVCPFALAPLAELGRTIQWLRPRFLALWDEPGPDLAALLAREGVAPLRLQPDPDRGFGAFRIAAGSDSAGSPLPLALAGPDDIALILPTSGTTGRPKMVGLRHRHLGHMAISAAQTLSLTPEDICVNPMPMHHIHGIAIGTFLPLASGGSTVPIAAPSGAAILAAAERTGATWYTAVPTLHQDVLRAATETPPDLSRLRLRFARSSSSALAASTREGLQARLAIPVLEGLGMTEAASWVLHQAAGSVHGHGTVGRGQGVEIAVLDSGGKLQHGTGLTGEMVVRGPNVITAYLDDPESDTRFVEGWLRTGDLVRLTPEGEVSVVGRLKEMVNRGGATIAPVEVEDVLLSHPAVQQAMAFGVPHPTLGQELAACVVLRPGATLPGSEIRRWVNTRLSAEKRPRQIVPVAALPLNAVGKPERIRAAQILHDLLPGAAAAPVGMVEAILVGILAELLPQVPIGRSTDLFLAGADSLLLLRLQLRLQETFGITPHADDLGDHPTILELADLLTERTDPDRMAEIAALWSELAGDDGTRQVVA